MTAGSPVNGMFERLARVVVRRPWLVIATWLLLVAVLSVAVPPLMKLASDRNQELLPSRLRGHGRDPRR